MHSHLRLRWGLLLFIYPQKYRTYVNLALLFKRKSLQEVIIKAVMKRICGLSVSGLPPPYMTF